MEDMETVYRRHAQTVYKFLLSQCHSAQMAEELTQETFYQAVRSIDRFDGGCKVSVWLCQIAKHLWYQQLRKARRETELPEETALPPLPSSEDEAVGRAGQVELLRQIHSLPEPGREVVYLRGLRRSFLPGDRRGTGEIGKLGPGDVLSEQGTLAARRQ